MLLLLLLLLLLVMLAGCSTTRGSGTIQRKSGNNP
jgi:predicted small secreted protein